MAGLVGKIDQYNQHCGYVLTFNFGGALDHIEKPAHAKEQCALDPGNRDQYAAMDHKWMIKRLALIAQIRLSLVWRGIIGWIITKRINKVIKRAKSKNFQYGS